MIPVFSRHGDDTFNKYESRVRCVVKKKKKEERPLIASARTRRVHVGCQKYH